MSIKTLAKVMVFRLFAGVCLFLAHFPLLAAVVLQYHHVSDDTPRSTSISPKLFAEHLDYLEQLDYQVWPLQDIATAMKNKQPLPDKIIAITFDDAYDSIFDIAFPLLREKGYPFTVFVSSEPLDQKVPSYMSWNQLRELQKGGATIGNHGHAHMHYVRRLTGENDLAWRKRIEQDISYGAERIRQELGSDEKMLAYPYGEYTESIQMLVDGLGYVAFGQQSGAIGPDIPITALPRFPMTDVYGAMAQFEIKVATLPLPIKSISPSERIVKAGHFAKGLRIEFTESLGPMNCFLSGAGRVVIEQKDSSVVIPTMPELPVGRSRLNCTIHSPLPAMAGRYHWFSYFWMTPEASGQWYQER